MKLTIRNGAMLLLSVAAPIANALPFSITPVNPQLPTQVVAGGSQAVFYTVQNNTMQTLFDVYAKYLPPNVTQVTDYPGFCGKNTTLKPKGNPGDSCTLYLLVWGDVNAHDPNPHNHLFMCSQGGISCAGVSKEYALNVQSVQKPPIYTAGARYRISADIESPLVGQSVDLGNVWSYPINSETPTLPNDFSTLETGNGDFNAGQKVSDKGPVGIAVYSYSTITETTAPLLYATTNAGQNWSIKIDSSTPTLPNNYSSIIFSDGICATNKYCIAVGNFNTTLNPNKMPLVMVSQNGANTWNMSEVVNLPAGFQSGLIDAIDCNASANCAAVGHYTTNANPTINYPFVLLNHSDNNTWTFAALPYPNDYSNSSSTQFETGLRINYDNQGEIIVGGNYVPQTKASSNYPFAVVSQNFGLNWQLVLQSANYSNYNSAYIDAVCCDGNYCSAAGRVIKGTGMGATGYPSLYASSNGGMSWSEIINDTNQARAPVDNGATPHFGTVACKGPNAIAGGYYYSDYSSPAALTPLLAVTKNGWSTFEYTLDGSTVNTIPEYHASGAMQAISIGDNVTLIAGGGQTTAPALGNNNFSPLLAVSPDLGYTLNWKVYGNTPTLPNNYDTSSSNYTQFVSVSANNPSGIKALLPAPPSRMTEALNKLAPQYPLIPMAFLN